MKYTGTLAKPIARKRMGVLAGETQLKAEELRTNGEMFAKLPDLFKAHGVIENDFVSLALALAQSHVPGFHLAEPAGRPTQWGDYDKAQLRVAIDDMVTANKSIPITQAIAKVCRLPQWAEKTKGMKAGALRKHYDAADMRWVQVARDAKAYESIAREV